MKVDDFEIEYRLNKAKSILYDYTTMTNEETTRLAVMEILKVLQILNNNADGI